MTLSTIGPLRVRSFGGSDRRGGGDGPAILLCHGFGAPGDDTYTLQATLNRGMDPECGVLRLDQSGRRTQSVPGPAGRCW